MKNKTMIDKLIPYLKRGYRSSFEMQQYLQSSSGDRVFRRFRTFFLDEYYSRVLDLWIEDVWDEGDKQYQFKEKGCHKEDGTRYLRWKLVRV